jgi:MscS family membrane protein
MAAVRIEGVAKTYPNGHTAIRHADLDKLPPTAAEVKAMQQATTEIDTDTTLIVNFNEFAASSLNFVIYTFTKTVEWAPYHEVKQDVLLKVAAIIHAHGAEVAFPTRTLHIESGPGLETATQLPG